MAEGCVARVVRCLTDAALCLRRPARRYAGSVQTAAIVSAIFVGAYNLVIGSVYLTENRRFIWGMSGMITTAGFLAFISTLGDVALVFGILRRKPEYLHSIVCAGLAAYLLCASIPYSVIIGLMYNSRWIFQLWELPRLLIYPLYIGLLYCLLVEVRDDSSRIPEHAPPPPAGWLRSNLACQEPSPPSGDGLLLKVPSGDHKPIITPSQCITAAPVHVPFRAVSPHAYGPLSSSEA